MEDALEGRAFTVPADVDEDADLADLAKTDARAFGDLYERYYPRIYRYTYHRLGNAADAEDVTALVFMKALEALPTFQSSRSGFAPWIFRITRNAVVDSYRRRRSQSGLESIEHRASDDDPVSDVLRTEQRSELHRLVEHLSPEQRDVVLMRYVADLSFAEIAATLRKNEAAVRMLLHRGLRKLKAVMGDE